MNIFIAGPRAIRHLPAMVQDRLHAIVKNGFTVFVGDADGIDKAVQSYIAKQNYPNVKVFASEGKARNNIGKWEVVTVAVNSNVKGFDFYAAKDRAMAHAADYGLMLWNGESMGTLNNILNLVAKKKSAVVYFTPRHEFAHIDTQAALDALIAHCNSGTQELYHKLHENIKKFAKQGDAVQSSFIEFQLSKDSPQVFSAEEVFPNASPAMALRGFRGKMEWTQQELAEKLGTTQNCISDMESGKRTISKAMAARLGGIFDIAYKVFL